VGDIFVVNKADHPGVDQTVRELRAAVRLAGHEPGQWRQPVVTTVATRGEGVDDLLDAIDRHQEWAIRTGTAVRRRSRRVREEIEAIALTELRRRFAALGGDRRLEALVEKVLSGDEDPYS